MKRTPLRLALVGTGGRGRIYADVLKRLAPGRAVWAALCDTREDVLNDFREHNALDAPGFPTVAAMLRGGGIDAALICTPDYAHRDPAVDCFRAGLHCLVEKPLATNPDDARAICAAARESGQLLHLGFILRYDPCAAKLRELVAGGAIGRPVACIVHEAVEWFHGATYMRRWNRFREYSGDMLLHKGCHTLDIINFIAGAYPTRVTAFGGNSLFVPRADAGERCDRCDLAPDCLYYADQGPEYRDRFYRTAGPQRLPEPVCVYNTEKDTTDTVTLAAEFDNGMRLSYTMTMASPRGERRVTLIGAGGEIRCDLSTYRIELTPIPDRPTQVIDVPKPEGCAHQQHDRELLEHFLTRVAAGDDPEAGIQDAYLSGAVAFAALELLQSGRAVDVG